MDPDKHQIMTQVYRAKKDNAAADEMIEAYMPFIKAETAKFINRSPDQSDDELSIAMFAFYEAIRGYSRLKGSFLKFAALKIRNRLIDFYRREKDIGYRYLSMNSLRINLICWILSVMSTTSLQSRKSVKLQSLK